MKNPVPADKKTQIEEPLIDKYGNIINRNCILTETKNRLVNVNVSLKSDIDLLSSENVSLKQNNEKFLLKGIC